MSAYKGQLYLDQAYTVMNHVNIWKVQPNNLSNYELIQKQERIFKANEFIAV